MAEDMYINELNVCASLSENWRNVACITAGPSNVGNLVAQKCDQVLLIGSYGLRGNGSLHFLHITFPLKFVQSLPD